jgi:hypothetical protein
VSSVVRQLHIHETTSYNLVQPPDFRRCSEGSFAHRPHAGIREAATALTARLGGVAPDGGPRSSTASLTRSRPSSKTLRKQRAELEEFLEQVTRQLALLEGFTTWQVTTAKSAGGTRARPRAHGRSAEWVRGRRRRHRRPRADQGQSSVAARCRGRALHDFRVSEERRDAENEKRAAELSQEVLRLKVRTSELTDICAAQENGC